MTNVFYQHYSHLITSDRWNTLSLAANESGISSTIFNALVSWMSTNSSMHVRYTDVCQGVYVHA